LIDSELTGGLLGRLDQSFDGNRLAYIASTGRVWALDLKAGAFDVVAVDDLGRLTGTGNGVAMSGDGRSVFFTTNWLPTDVPGFGTNPFTNVFLTELPETMPVPTYVAMTPQRLVDTRPGTRTADGQAQGGGPLGALGSFGLRVAGRVGVPYTASAVVLNITVTEAASAGYLAIFPCIYYSNAGYLPDFSNVNFQRGVTRANSVLISINLDFPELCILTSANAHVIADISGYFPLGAELFPTDPFRIVDTRQGGSTFDGNYQGTGELRPGEKVRFKIPFALTGEAAVLNLTSTRSRGSGFITAWPCDQDTPPNASHLNFEAGQDVANLAIVAVNDQGEVCFQASAPTELLLDVSGYMFADSGYVPTSPKRLLDTRAAGLTIDGQFSGGGVRSAGSRLELAVAGRGGVPRTARSVVLNVTATGTTGPGFLTVWPCDSASAPNASNVNFLRSQTVPNLVVASISSRGSICLQTSESGAHLIADVNGWFDTSSLAQRSNHVGFNPVAALQDPAARSL
jgi:hypothetical protein